MTLIYTLIGVALFGCSLIGWWAFSPKSTLAWRAAGWGMIIAFPAMAALLVLQGLMMFGVWSA